MNVKKISDVIRFDPEKMQKITLFENKRMFCDVYCLEAGQHQLVHSHDRCDKIYYVLQGEGSFTVDSETRLLKAGDIVCAWSGQSHGVENASSGRLTCLVFMAPHPQPQKFES